MPGKIQKMRLQGAQDVSNEYWTSVRKSVLDVLYGNEKNILVNLDGSNYTMKQAVSTLHQAAGLPITGEAIKNTSACIVERIILKLYDLDKFPTFEDDSIEKIFQKELGRSTLRKRNTKSKDQRATEDVVTRPRRLRLPANKEKWE